MICYNVQYLSNSAMPWISPQVNSKDDIYCAMLFTLRESRRTSDSALLRIRSKKLRLHPQAPWLWNPPAFATLGYICSDPLVYKNPTRVVNWNVFLSILNLDQLLSRSILW